MAEALPSFGNGQLLLAVGVLQALLPVGSAITLVRRRSRAVEFWLLGSVCGSSAAVLVGLRDSVDPFWSFNVANTLLVWYGLLRIRVMLEHLGIPPRSALTFPAMSVNYLFWYYLAKIFLGPVARIIVANLCGAAVFGWCAWLAGRLALRRASPSGLVIALAQAFLASAMLVRGGVAAATGAVLHAATSDGTIGVIAVVGLAVAVVENFSYLGLVMEEQEHTMVHDAANAARRTEAQALSGRLSELETRSAVDLLARAVTSGLRPPLEAIMASARKVRTGDEEASSAIEVIDTSARHAMFTLDGLRALVKPSNGRSDRLALDSVVEAVCDVLAFQARSSGVELVTADATLRVDVVADRVHLSHVLVHVIGRAVAAAAASGEACVTIGGQIQAGRVRVTVSRAGAGAQPDRSTRTGSPIADYKGFSDELGLTVAETLLESMGGRLEIRSTFAESGAMTIDLPAGPPLSRAHATYDAIH